MYLPPDPMLNKDFLRKILIEEKKLLSLSEVKWIEVPKFDEISVKALWPTMQEDDSMMEYFPSQLPKGRLPDRSYFFNIMHSLYPVYTSELVRVA